MLLLSVLSALKFQDEKAHDGSKHCKNNLSSSVSLLLLLLLFERQTEEFGLLCMPSEPGTESWSPPWVA